jgi:hypothetical protein
MFDGQVLLQQCRAPVPGNAAEKGTAALLMLSTLGADGPDASAFVLLWALYFCACATVPDPDYPSTPTTDDGSVATFQPAVVQAAELARRSPYNTFSIVALLGPAAICFLRIFYRWITDVMRCARLNNHVRLAWATEARAFRASPAAQQPTQRKGPITRGLSNAAKLLSAQFKEERAKAQSESRNRFHGRHARAKKALSSLAPRALLMLGLAQLALLSPAPPALISAPTSSQLSMAPVPLGLSVSPADEQLEHLVTSVLGEDMTSVLAQPWLADAVWETLQASVAGPTLTLTLTLTLQTRPHRATQVRPCLLSPRRW